jgi:hypothetical protein
MRLYLTTPPGQFMADTRWLLQQRGYRVVSDQDMLSPNYVYNHGLRPTPGDVRRLRVLAMLECDAVVLHDATPRPDRRHHLHLCRFADIPAVRYHDLPAQCPAAQRELEVLASLDLLRHQRRSWAQRISDLRARITCWRIVLRARCLAILPKYCADRMRRRNSRIYPVSPQRIAHR